MVKPVVVLALIYAVPGSVVGGPVVIQGRPNEIVKENYKPSRQLIQILVDIVAKNGNLLLNIGPGPDGEWHQEAYQRLNDMAAWMKVNGESIYNTKPVAPYRQGQWAFTKSKTAHYVSYLAAEKETLLPAALSFTLADVAKKATISLLGVKQQLKWEKAGDIITVHIPENIRQQTTGQPVWVFKII